MPGSFTYDADTAFEESDDGFAIPYVVLGPSHQSKLIQFVMSAGTGDKVVTGVGFQPECIILFGAIIELDTLREAGRWHLGVATDPTEQWTIGCTASDNVVPAVRTGVFHDDKIIGVGTEATLVSFDADGFTLNVSAGSSTLPIVALCLRGGTYQAGTDVIPASTGVDTISVGFQPACVFTAASRKTANGASAGIEIGLGAMDGTRQTSVWAGADTAQIRARSYMEPDICITMARENGVSPAVLAQAVFDSFGATDFALDWLTVDGNAYKYGYLALSDAATDLFIHSLASGVVVPTPVAPTALLGFHTTVKPADYATFVQAITIGVSGCDEDLLERGAAFHDHDNPPAGAQQTDSYLPSWFGGAPRQLTGGGVSEAGAHATVHDVNIVAFSSGFRPQIYRRVVQRLVGPR